jgi:hypothetical protein
MNIIVKPVKGRRRPATKSVKEIWFKGEPRPCFMVCFSDDPEFIEAKVRGWCIYHCFDPDEIDKVVA